jgi:3-oxoacyl-[acyl-carrier protein] reductase
MLDLTGKVAIVTGGTRGIGKAIVKKLSAQGAVVALNYRKSAKEAEELVEELKQDGKKAVAIQADVSNFNDAQEMVKKVVDEFGKIDILVTNAGMNWDGVIWKMTEEQWDRVIEVDLKGTFNYIRAVAPIMRENKWGRLITITSINGLRGKFGQTNYSAAKGGVIGLTKASAKDLGKYGITANSVAPGFILTEMGESMPDEFKQTAINESAVKKAGKPDDIANLVVFLASEEGGHITGEVIKVDGGQYI